MKNLFSMEEFCDLRMSLILKFSFLQFSDCINPLFYQRSDDASKEGRRTPFLFKPGVMCIHLMERALGGNGFLHAQIQWLDSLK